MASSIIAMARYRSMLRWTCSPAKCMAKPPPRHTSEEFVDFLGQVVGLCQRKQEIHIILDNLAAQ